MRVLLDECLPVGLRHDLAAAGTIETARYAGLLELSNGKLLDAMVGKYDVLVTADNNLRYQQTIVGRPVAVIVLRPATNTLADLRPMVPMILSALRSIKVGTVIEI